MKRFSIVNNGYDINEVNRFIDIVIQRLEKLNTENSSYLAKIDELELKLKDNKEDDTRKLDKAILSVQDASDKMREVAKEEARIIVEEARNNANAILHEALIDAQKTEQERMILEKNIKVYKNKIKTLLEGQMSLVSELDKVDLEEKKDDG